MSGRYERFAPPCQTKSCTANKKGLCIALSESFPEGDCPFFRDRKSMSRLERFEYERLADYITAKEKPQ